jgi:hypothetical protein
MLLEIFMPIILVVGCAGNLISFYIFTRPNVRGLSTFRFLAYLSVVDLLYLLIGLPHIIVIVYSGYDFRMYSNLVCSLHSFLTLYLSHVSSNILAGVGIFRCVTITRLKPPNKQQTMPSRKSTHNAHASKKRAASAFCSNHETQLLAVNKHLSGSSAHRQRSSFRFSLNARITNARQSLKTNFGNADAIIFALMLILFVFDSHFLIYMRLNDFGSPNGQDLLSLESNGSVNGSSIGTNPNYGDNYEKVESTGANFRCYPSPEIQKVTFSRYSN